jgi:hypothetical protein
VPWPLESEINQRLIRLNIIRLADLRDYVHITYWSEIHFVTEDLLNLLPFGRALGPTKFYEFVDLRFPTLLSFARQTLNYWEGSPVYTYNQDPVKELTLSFDETFFWHYYTPAKTQEITRSILQGNRIRFLSRFHLSETEIKVEFQEIRLQTTDFGTRLVGALGKEYTYKWSDSLWSISLLNSEIALVDPTSFYYPISEPNALGREAEYRDRLGIILQHQDNFGIERDYWNSVDSTETDSDLPELSSSPPRILTPPPLDHCGCGIDLCYCDIYRPDTPPTPPYIELWHPRLGHPPIQGLHIGEFKKLPS